MSEGFIVPIPGYKRAYAAISVTYPSGSVCTCTHSDKGKVLTAKDTSGSWIFVVPYGGTWTVKSTQGSNSASQNVSITAEGQTQSVTLSYWNGELFVSGVGQYTDKTGGWALYRQNSYVTGTVSNTELKVGYTVNTVENGSGHVYTKKAVDFTGFTKLNATVSLTKRAGWSDSAWIAITRSGTQVAGVDISNRNTSSYNGTVSLSISGLSNGVVELHIYNSTLRTTKVWMSK